MYGRGVTSTFRIGRFCHAFALFPRPCDRQSHWGGEGRPDDADARSAITALKDGLIVERRAVAPRWYRSFAVACIAMCGRGGLRRRGRGEYTVRNRNGVEWGTEV